MATREINIYQVDTFTNKVFKGNPAAVCVLSDWLPENMMQQIAAENNLAETAFSVCDEHGVYHIRWFTPTVEVDLCGHATLATAYVLFEELAYKGECIHFYSHRSGALKVSKEHSYYHMNFPVDKIKPVSNTKVLEEALHNRAVEIYRGKTDLILVFENQDVIEKMKPDLNLISQIDARGIIVTAPGDTYDFVSRFFGPQSGIDEDPATGSAHTSLIPYWAARLGKTKFKAIQLSARRGWIDGELIGDRVVISGEAILYMKGKLYCS